MADRKITGIYISSGVAMREPHDGFCQVDVTLEDGTSAVAQLSPADVRKTAHDWVEAAEGALHDAAVFKVLTSQGEDPLDTNRAAHFIAMLRDYRQDAESMVEHERSDVSADHRPDLIQDDARTTDQ